MHKPEVLKKLALSEKDARLKMRYLALYHFALNENRTQIAKFLGVGRGSVNRWVASYLSKGLEGLRSKPSPGRPNALSAQQKQLVSMYVKEHAVKSNGGRLIAEDIRLYIKDSFNIEYTLRNIYHLLHASDFSWITSRSKHPKQSQDAQDSFKKIQIRNDRSHTIERTT
jgi:transposase